MPADVDFPREARLRRRREFDEVMTGGRKVVNRQLVAWVLERPDAARPRLGLAIGRKIGNSPTRNRVKRVLREAFRHLAPQLPGPVDVVVVARAGAAPRDLAEARSSLAHLLRRARR